MLRNAKTIDNRRLLRCRIHQRCLSQMIRINVADFRYFFWCVFFYNLFELLKAFCPCLNKFLVRKSFVDNHVHHAVCKRNVRAGL